MRSKRHLPGVRKLTARTRRGVVRAGQAASRGTAGELIVEVIQGAPHGVGSSLSFVGGGNCGGGIRNSQALGVYLREFIDTKRLDQSSN